MQQKNTVYIIAGSTAVGKTSIAISLAKRLGTEIISADSRQCYKEMSIGTAKPTEAELAEVPHHFINSHSITEHLSAADYEQEALAHINKLLAAKDTAVVCGGTGLYIKVLCEGIDAMPEVDKNIVVEVQQGYEQHGIAWLQQLAQEEDPKFYSIGEVDNPARLIRALAFKRSVGDSIVQYRSGSKKKRPFNIIKIALDLPREVLYDRINRRVDLMMKEGLLEEAKALYPQKGIKNLQTVGYSELFDYFDGKCNLEDAIDKIKQHSRNYAKRQLTWFRKDEEMNWLRADDKDIIEKICSIK